MRWVTPTMELRLLVAEGDPEFRKTLRELGDTARGYLPIEVEIGETGSEAATQERVAAWRPDAVLLDWNIAGEATPAFIGALQTVHPEVRVLVLLPGSLPEYRRAVWEAGGCAGIPRDRVEAEWLATALCIMRRAMQREERLRTRVRQLCPVMAEVMR